MTFTYNGNPGESVVTEVRFYLQDTEPARPLLTDEEISHVLDQWEESHNSSLWAAAVCAEVLAARYAGLVNVSGDGTSVDQDALQRKYDQLATSLRDQYKALYGMSGPLLSDMFDQSYDSSIEPLVFGVGMMDNAWAGRQNYGDNRDVPELTPESW